MTAIRSTKLDFHFDSKALLPGPQGDCDSDQEWGVRRLRPRWQLLIAILMIKLFLACSRSMGASVRDSDSDEEWGDGGCASDGGTSAGAWDDGEVEVSPEDERAMAAFMVSRTILSQHCLQIPDCGKTSSQHQRLGRWQSGGVTQRRARHGGLHRAQNDHIHHLLHLPALPAEHRSCQPFRLG